MHQRSSLINLAALLSVPAGSVALPDSSNAACTLGTGNIAGTVDLIFSAKASVSADGSFWYFKRSSKIGNWYSIKSSTSAVASPLFSKNFLKYRATRWLALPVLTLDEIIAICGIFYWFKQCSGANLNLEKNVRLDRNFSTRLLHHPRPFLPNHLLSHHQLRTSVVAHAVHQRRIKITQIFTGTGAVIK